MSDLASVDVKASPASQGHQLGQLPDVLSALLLVLLLALTLSYITTELTYDESIYLCIARNIVASGLPVRRDFNNLGHFELFQNSPPLLMYVASATQRWFPGQDMPSRLVHIILFVVPIYFGVWWVSRRWFGPWAGVASLLALLGSGDYLNRTHNVQLDVPLGLFAVIALLAFDKACRKDKSRLPWCLTAAVALMFAAWTKYQAICISAAIPLYCGFLMVSQGRASAKRFMVPFVVMVFAGALALVVLVVLFKTFGGEETLAQTVTYNAERMNAGHLGLQGTLRAVLAIGTRCVSTLGALLIFASCAGLLLQGRHRGGLVILASYVLMSFLFNIWFFRLPGSGLWYLHSVVPAMAIMAGAAASALVDLTGSRLRGGLIGLIAAAIQFFGSPPPVFMPPYINGQRLAGQYIASKAGPEKGVLSTTSAIEFYSGNPVATRPEVLLQSLAGTGGNDIAFIAIPRGEQVAGTEKIKAQWDEILQRYFVVAPIDIPTMVVYQRKSNIEK
jgi:hypothetical protein